jgi:type III restriction enzyme
VLENTRMSSADRWSEGLVRDDMNYNEYAYLLYKLAREIVKHLESYLPNEDDVRNVLQYHQTPLANIIHSQMHGHFGRVL